MSDEFVHKPGPGALWGESWYFDFASADHGISGYVRVGVYPNLGVTWLWLVLVGDQLDASNPVQIVDHGMALPTLDASGLAVSDGSRTCRLRCEEPHAQWSVQMDTADEVWLDLRWRSTTPEYRYQATTRYEQSARVTGTVSVRGRQFTVDAPGQRDHSWGVRDWWRIRWVWLAAHLNDGTRLHVTQLLLPRPFPAYGYIAAPDGRMCPIDRTEVVGKPETAAIVPDTTKLFVGSLAMTLVPRHPTSIRLDGPEGQTGTLLRSTYRIDTADGRAGSGWLEWNLPGVEPSIRNH